MFCICYSLNNRNQVRKRRNYPLLCVSFFLERAKLPPTLFFSFLEGTEIPHWCLITFFWNNGLHRMISSMSYIPGAWIDRLPWQVFWLLSHFGMSSHRPSSTVTCYSGVKTRDTAAGTVAGSHGIPFSSVRTTVMQSYKDYQKEQTFSKKNFRKIFFWETFDMY